MDTYIAPPEQPAETWQTHLAELGAEQGFFEEISDEHSALFVQSGKTLVVTFDNLDMVTLGGEARMPWGFSFVQSKGWSVLGVMSRGWTWYRDENLFDFFDRLQKDGFFEQFDQVVFYGASMGAYAACAFSSAVPGATVIAISPQATLDRELTSWETRFKKAWRRNYNTRYGYAPDQVKTAKKVYLFFDPTDKEDAMHAALFQSDNVEKLHCRNMGHRIASLWLSMGILKPVTEACVDHTLNRTQLYTWFRKRRDSLRFQKELLVKLKREGRHALMIRYCNYILGRTPRRPHFRSELRNARDVLHQQKLARLRRLGLVPATTAKQPVKEPALES
jgi:hypothetical protein